MHHEIPSVGGVGVLVSIFVFLLHATGTFVTRIGFGFEVAACQSDTTEMVNAAIFPISRCGQRNARRAPNPSVAFLILSRKWRDRWTTNNSSAANGRIKIWEDEGRPEGARDDHWKRAEEQHGFEQEADDVTKVNQEPKTSLRGTTRRPRRPQILSRRQRSARTEGE